MFADLISPKNLARGAVYPHFTELRTKAGEFSGFASGYKWLEAMSQVWPLWGYAYCPLPQLLGLISV